MDASMAAEAAASTDLLTPPVATVIAACAAALVSLTVAVAVAVAVAVVTVISSWRNEKGKQRHALDMAKLDAENKSRNARLDLLRTAAAEYSGLAVEEVDYAAHLIEDPGSQATRELLLAAHTRLRVAYEQLLLISDSVPVQEAARQALRIAWNERQEGLGRPRIHPRIPPGAAPAKAMRTQLRHFTREVREELGLSDELLNEPID